MGRITKRSQFPPQHRRKPSLDDRVITKVVSVLKDIKSMPISESPRADSAISDSESDKEDARYKYFTKFLESNLKRKKNKPSSCFVKAKKPLTNLPNSKIKDFSPIQICTRAAESQQRMNPIQMKKMPPSEMNKKFELAKTRS